MPPAAERRPPGYATARRDQIPQRVRDEINRSMKSRAWPLYIHGTVGTGKTMTAACLYGIYPRLPQWHRADDLLISMATGRVGGVSIDTLNRYHETVRREIPFTQFASRVASASCLFLDDLGTRKPTETMYQALFDLIEWRRDKPLVITSNKSPDELTEPGWYDDRIYSRLVSGTVIRLDGVDRRETGRLVAVRVD